VNEAHVRVGLRKVAPHPEIRGLIIFGEKAEGRQRGMDVFHDSLGIRGPARRGERLHEPEGADDKCHGRLTEAIVETIAKEPPIPGKSAPNRVDRAAQSRIIWRKKTEARHLKEGRIQVPAAVRSHEAAWIRAPGPCDDLFSNASGG